MGARRQAESDGAVHVHDVASLDEGRRAAGIGIDGAGADGCRGGSAGEVGAARLRASSFRLRQTSARRVGAAIFLCAERKEKLVRTKGLEPSRLAAPDPKSGVSANSTTRATGFSLEFHGAGFKFQVLWWSLHLFPERGLQPASASTMERRAKCGVGFHFGNGSGINAALRNGGGQLRAPCQNSLEMSPLELT